MTCFNVMAVLLWNDYDKIVIVPYRFLELLRVFLGNMIEKLRPWFQRTIEGSSSSHSSENGTNQERRRLLSVA
jgi:hypothetical protein